MTLALETETLEPATGLRLVDTPEALAAIRNPGCAAAIWQRTPAPGFQSWIEALAPSLLPSGRVTLRPADVRDAATQICDSCGTPESPERRMLIDDTAAAAEIFAEIMHAAYIRLRFDVIATNACRKFHIDNVTARLICTYRGIGTQYGFATSDGDPGEIFTVATGSPILLRGRLWPERPDARLRHRSPPIEGTGETRLVLVLDPMEAPDGPDGSPLRLH